MSLANFCLGGWHFLRKGGPNLQKVGIDKTGTPPISATKILSPPHHRYILPLEQAKIVLKSVLLNKINTLSVVILWLPTFWSSKIVWPPYVSSQKCMTPPVYLDPPPSEENANPLSSCRVEGGKNMFMLYSSVLSKEFKRGRWDVVPPDFARSFSVICAHYRCSMFYHAIT